MPQLVDKKGNIDYFGRLSWANLVDWMVTLCLGAIIALTSLRLGGVRPETQLAIVPVFVLLLVLHGVWLAVNRERPRLLHPAPFFFLPFLLWASYNVVFLSPVPWRGGYELSYLFSAFIFFWVAVNNVRTRAHLWVLLIIGLLPFCYAAYLGFYQFFQGGGRMADASAGYRLELNAQYAGQSTGVFADPSSFAAYLLVLLPCMMISAFVPRLPNVLRLMCFYLGLIVLVGITFTQSYWATAVVVLLVLIVPWFCFRKTHRRMLFSALGLLLALLVFIGMFFYSPPFNKGLQRAFTDEGEGVRLRLWEESLNHVVQSPIAGNGAASYALNFEQSRRALLDRVPLTPHNDYLLVLDHYGLIGALFLFVPLIYILVQAYRTWMKQPFHTKLKNTDGLIMPSQKFFLSVAFCAVLASGMGAFFTPVIYIPALLLMVTLLVAILAKNSIRRTVPVPSFRFSGLGFVLIAISGASLFWSKVSLSLGSQALELQARQRLEHFAGKRLVLSEYTELLDRVIRLYEDAVIADPGNADAWIGLSMAICQQHYRNPSEFVQTGKRALDAALKAYELCPEFWLSSAQVGVSYALLGDHESANEAFARSVEMAPNSSNAHYYYASFLSNDDTERERALKHVERALLINPENAPARQLQRKLRIL